MPDNESPAIPPFKAFLDLIETRISDVQPGDLWYLEGGWVTVDSTDPAPHPDDRVAITYVVDGDPTELGTTSEYYGWDVAIVKR
jgi:hypothetical protein